MIAHGTPAEIAAAIYAALRNRRSTALYAVVMREDDTAELVEVETKKYERIERDRFGSIAGCYGGSHSCNPRVTMEEIREAIEATLGEAV